MSKSRLGVLAIFVLGAFAVGCGQAPMLQHPTDPSTDFYQVSPGIYRGGRLTEAGVARLHALGVKTILNLEDDKHAVKSELKWAQASSIVQISSPLSGRWWPSDRQVDKLLTTIADKSMQPIYVHCMKGMDRTGLIIALHRVINEGWTPSRAEAERNKLGFNSWLVDLDNYYAFRTDDAHLAHLARLARAKH